MFNRRKELQYLGKTFLDMQPPSIHVVMGGSNSGKSTILDNLLISPKMDLFNNRENCFTIKNAISCLHRDFRSHALVNGDYFCNDLFGSSHKLLKALKAPVDKKNSDQADAKVEVIPERSMASEFLRKLGLGDLELFSDSRYSNAVKTSFEFNIEAKRLELIYREISDGLNYTSEKLSPVSSLWWHQYPSLDLAHIDLHEDSTTLSEEELKQRKIEAIKKTSESLREAMASILRLEPFDEIKPEVLSQFRKAIPIIFFNHAHKLKDLTLPNEDPNNKIDNGRIFDMFMEWAIATTKQERSAQVVLETSDSLFYNWLSERYNDFFVFRPHIIGDLSRTEAEIFYNEYLKSMGRKEPADMNFNELYEITGGHMQYMSHIIKRCIERECSPKECYFITENKLRLSSRIEKELNNNRHLMIIYQNIQKDGFMLAEKAHNYGLETKDLRRLVELNLLQYRCQQPIVEDIIDQPSAPVYVAPTPLDRYCYRLLDILK